MPSTTIRIKKETARELAKIMGELTAKTGKKASYDDAIKYLLGKKKENRLKAFIEKTFEGATSEDFKEYDYGDI
ncbi:hypothetical protein [Archaeoglobus veneficus]|uniref:VapB-type antitoxin n=1 Tax=Archaeoglobus veneficus (strain DSM 11195 / SNP6) TaxID=693661 RepID=F2KSQ0_ARCVS|nr:hypothetical protein [Archaeoglobus veneficus]AEA46945.1 hypothetical protein Arcve_0934 [Archaeoglobus veneficus SNP6]